VTTQEYRYTLHPPFGRQAKKAATRRALIVVDGGISA
jgi:hypothetical protein